MFICQIKSYDYNSYVNGTPNPTIEQILKEDYSKILNTSSSEIDSDISFKILHFGLQIPFSRPIRYIDKNLNYFSGKYVDEESEEIISRSSLEEIDGEDYVVNNFSDNDLTLLISGTPLFELKVGETRILEYSNLYNGSSSNYKDIARCSLKFKDNIPRETILDIGYIVQ